MFGKFQDSCTDCTLWGFRFSKISTDTYLLLYTTFAGLNFIKSKMSVFFSGQLKQFLKKYLSNFSAMLNS